MTELEENTLMLVASLIYFKGLTIEELKEKADWLKNISIFGIETWLTNGIRKGYIYDKSKGKKIVYYATNKGKKEYEKKF